MKVHLHVDHNGLQMKQIFFNRNNISHAISFGNIFYNGMIKKYYNLKFKILLTNYIFKETKNKSIKILRLDIILS